MPGPIALTDTCCQPRNCSTPQTIQIPGANGAPGAAGDDGDDGLSPVTTTTAQFLMPAEGANVTVAVVNSEGLVPGQVAYVQNAGYMEVVSKPGNTSVILKNLENTGSSLYTTNVAPTTAIAAGSLISPGGIQGPANSTSGAAGGQLKGSYPNPKLSIANTKGKMIVGNGTDADELTVGTNGQIPHARSAQPLGIQWSGIDLSGTNTSLSGTLPIARGGTGNTDPLNAFNALSPLVTTGDIIYHDGVDNAELPIGAAATVLKSNGTIPEWGLIVPANIDMSSGPLPRYGLLALLASANFNSTSDQQLNIQSGISRYIIRRITVETPSTSLSVAAGGIYTSPAKGGSAVVAAAQTYAALTTGNKWLDLTLAAFVGTDIMTVTTLYLSLTTPQGGAATARVSVWGENVSP